MRKFLITNHLPESLDTEVIEFFNIHVIYFNPWGFSISDIKNQARKATQEASMDCCHQFIFLLEDLFFGRRVNIAIGEVQSLYPKSEFFKIKSPKEIERLFAY